MIENKPIVYYLNSPTFKKHANDVWTACVYAINHPRLGTNRVYTSQIVGDFDVNGFETLNTIYKRSLDDEDL